MHRGSFGSRARSTGAVAILAALLAVFACACAGPALELPRTPAFRVTGEVLDGEGRPVAGAGVVLSGSPRGGLTDDAGRFEIEHVFAGRYGLAVLHAGFRSNEAPLVVEAPGAERFTLPMTRDRTLSSGLAGAVPDSLAPVAVSVQIEPEP